MILFPTNKKIVLWAITLGGVSIWLGFPNDFIELPLFIFLWPCCLVLLGMVSKGQKQSFLRGWLSTFIGTTAALYWLTIPMHLVGGLPWVGAASCALAVTACLSTQGGFFAQLVFLNRHLPSGLLALLLALCWIFLEIVYAVIAGFPWLPYAGALAPYPVLVQSAEILGMYGTSALWIFTSFLFFFSLPGVRHTHFSLRHFVLASFIVSSLLLQGFWSLERTPVFVDKKSSDALPVIFVEGNIDQAQKWAPALQLATVERYIQLSEEGLHRSQPELQGKSPLVVWPETALPYFFGRNSKLDTLVGQFIERNRISLLFGAPAEGTRPGSKSEPPVFNRAWLVGENGAVAGYYDKEHLVPFGEYVPDLLNLPFLSGLLQEVGMYTPGTNSRPVLLNEHNLGVLICYEGIFPWLAHNRVSDGADILADISNDGWFLRTPAAWQHLYLTTLRAIEQGRYILRGTNTGVSAVIDARGRIVWHGGQFQAISHLTWAKGKRDLTFYHKNAIGLAACGLLAIMALLYVSRKSKKDFA